MIQLAEYFGVRQMWALPFFLMAVIFSQRVDAQCPDITSSSITPANCSTTCLLCPGDQITITVEGFDLPDPGMVNFYVSNNPGFDPYLGQGTLIGSSSISTPQRMPCDDCPTMEAIMVNACGNEAANEFIMMSSGSGFEVSDMSINLPNGGFCGFSGSPNTGLVSGCAAVGVGPGGSVPAGAIVVIFVSSNADQVYDFSGSCTMGETVYVLQNSCPLAQPAFRNSCTGCGTRSTTFSLGCGCSGGITYSPEDLMDLDGEYVLAGGSPGQSPCSTAPSITVNPPDPLVSTVQPFTYTIPGSWCDLGPREIVGILSPAPTPPCTNQYTARFTVDVRCPEANPASAEACDNGNGTATFDLTLIEPQVTGGANIQVNWYSNANGTNPINSPYTTTSTTVYATVVDGCESDPVAVMLTVRPLPTAQSASEQRCDEGNGRASFPLTNLENQINGGSGNEVRFYLDQGATVRLLPPYTTATTTIYATVFDGQCSSLPVIISLVVLPSPPTQTATAEACDSGSGQASFNLTSLVQIVNAGTNNSVQWFADPDLTQPINSPYLTGSTVIYAVVSNGQCDSQPVEVVLTVKPLPVALPTTETICDDGSGVATFDLRSLDIRINGGTGSEVRYYLNPNDPQTIPSPFTTGTRIIFARTFEDGCASMPVPIELRVLPAPLADTASLTACADSSGIARFDLSSIEDLINRSSGHPVEWAFDTGFIQRVDNPYFGLSGTLYARVFNGGCYSQAVEISLSAIPGPRLEMIPDTSVCALFILPEIRGSGLSNEVAYFWQANGQGDTLFPGDTIRMDTSIYLFDRNSSGDCADEIAFRVSIRDSIYAGGDDSIAICEGTILDLFSSLDSADRGGIFVDLDGSGTLTDSLFASAGLNGMNFRFRYSIDPVAACPGDSSTITVLVVSSVSAGTGIRDTICSGTNPNLFDLLANADRGGDFELLDPGPVIESGMLNTSSVPEGEYRIRYRIGDGITCPKDSSLIRLFIRATPEIQMDDEIIRCEFAVLPTITGTNTGNSPAYFTGPGGTGSQLQPGDTVFTSVSLYVYAENGTCFDEKRIEVNISDEIVTNLRATLCSGEFLEVGNERFDASRPTGQVLFTGAGIKGCDSLVRVDIAFYPEARNEIRSTLCPGEQLVINGIIYDENRPTGREVLTGMAVNGCDSIIDVQLNFHMVPTGQLNATLCPGETLNFNNTVYDESNPSGADTLMGASINGCDSVVSIQLNFFPVAIGQLNETLCPGESLTVNGTTYDVSRLSGTDTLPGASANGCDSLVQVSISYLPEPRTMIRELICPEDFITVNQVRYDIDRPNGSEVLTGASANGCDSIVEIDLSFHPRAEGRIEQQLCFGQEITVNGVAYNENNPSGTEVFQGGSVNGCDSIVSISLQFSDAAYEQINETICPDEFVVVNQIRYDASNPSGSDTIPGGSAAGCDSIIVVSLNVLPESSGQYRDTLCAGDQIRIGNMMFNENQPSGQVLLPGGSANGCDSLLQVDLVFTEGRLNLPPQYTASPGQSVSIAASFTGNIRSIRWLPAEGLSCTDCLNPLAQVNRTTQFSIEIEDEWGCLYSAATTIRIEENFRVFVPNAFTPNDDGVNDRFTLMTGDQVERILYMRIFDRWGNLVYSEENSLPGEHRGWDGSYKNKLLDPAVFVVVAAVEFTGGKIQYLQRDLTLIR